MDAEFWVALGFIVFAAGLAYLGVHTRLGEALDDRARKVADELAEAKRLHEEAAVVLDTFKRKAAAASPRRPPRPVPPRRMPPAGRPRPCCAAIPTRPA